MTPSKWGNPYRVKKYGRTEAIKHFGRMLETRPDLLEALGELDGAVLRCHCKEGEHCHGDEIIASWARHRGRVARPRTSRVWGKGPPHALASASRAPRATTTGRAWPRRADGTRRSASFQSGAS